MRELMQFIKMAIKGGFFCGTADYADLFDAR